MICAAVIAASGVMPYLSAGDLPIGTAIPLASELQVLTKVGVDTIDFNGISEENLEGKYINGYRNQVALNDKFPLKTNLNAMTLETNLKNIEVQLEEHKQQLADEGARLKDLQDTLDQSVDERGEIEDDSDKVALKNYPYALELRKEIENMDTKLSERKQNLVHLEKQLKEVDDELTKGKAELEANEKYSYNDGYLNKRAYQNDVALKESKKHLISIPVQLMKHKATLLHELQMRKDLQSTHEQTANELEALKNPLTAEEKGNDIQKIETELKEFKPKLAHKEKEPEKLKREIHELETKKEIYHNGIFALQEAKNIEVQLLDRKTQYDDAVQKMMDLQNTLEQKTHELESLKSSLNAQGKFEDTAKKI